MSRRISRYIKQERFLLYNMNPLPRSDLKGKYPRCHYNKLGKAK